jgi:hypothetical protein
VVVNLNSDDYSDQEIDIFQPIKSLHFEPNWPPPLDVSSDKNSGINWYFFISNYEKHPLTGMMTWDNAVNTIPEDRAAYGVHAALTQSFNMCLSMEDFQFRCILGFLWGSSGRVPKKCCMKKANLFAR